MSVLRLRVSDDLPMVARVVVWPRDKGGYFIYVRPGTPRGDVRSAIRALKATSAVARELAVIAFAAKDAWKELFPRGNVMSIGAGLATLTVTASGLAVPPVLHHHGHARSILPSWADIDPDPVPDHADHVRAPAPSAPPHHLKSSPAAASPSGVPPLHSHAPRATATTRPAAAAPAHGTTMPGTSRTTRSEKSGTRASAAQRPDTPGKPVKANPAKANRAKTNQKPAKPAKSAKSSKSSSASHRG